MKSEKGELKDFSAVKILISIYENRYTGILYLKNGEDMKVLYFNRGKLTWAISNSENDQLEKLLKQEKIISDEALSILKEEGVESNNLGKDLVERGLINLQELIALSKKQLRGIVIGALKWEEGTYQFTQDRPPERLLSLDLKLTDFIVEYILKHLKIGLVWREIETLQAIFKKCTDQDKIIKFNLSDKQLDLLDKFDGKKNIEEILSTLGNIKQEPVLKVIYFFMVAGLICRDKKLEEGHGDFNFEKPQPVMSDYDMIDKEVNTDNDFIKEDSNNHLKDFESETKDVSFSLGDAGDLNNNFIDENIEKEKKSFNIYIIVAVFLLVVSLSLLFFKNKRDKKELESINDISKTPVVVNEKKIKVDTEPQSVKDVAVEIKKIEESKSVEVEMQSVEKSKEEDKKAIKPLVKDKNNNKKPVTPLQYMKEGKYNLAADLWRSSIKKRGWQFSIYLEYACSESTIKKAFLHIEQSSKEKEFFMLLSKRRNKGCYRLFFGLYKTRQDAEISLKKDVPAYFWQQENQPRVTPDLKSYLEN